MLKFIQNGRKINCGIHLIEVLQYHVTYIATVTMPPWLMACRSNMAGEVCVPVPSQISGHTVLYLKPFSFQFPFYKLYYLVVTLFSLFYFTGDKNTFHPLSHPLCHFSWIWVSWMWNYITLRKYEYEFFDSNEVFMWLCLMPKCARDCEWVEIIVC